MPPRRVLWPVQGNPYYGCPLEFRLVLLPLLGTLWLLSVVVLDPAPEPFPPGVMPVPPVAPLLLFRSELLVPGLRFGLTELVLVDVPVSARVLP